MCNSYEQLIVCFLEVLSVANLVWLEQFCVARMLDTKTAESH